MAHRIPPSESSSTQGGGGGGRARGSQDRGGPDGTPPDSPFRHALTVGTLFSCSIVRVELCLTWHCCFAVGDFFLSYSSACVCPIDLWRIQCLIIHVVSSLPLLFGSCLLSMFPWIYSFFVVVVFEALNNVSEMLV